MSIYGRSDLSKHSQHNIFDTYWNKPNLYCVYCIMVTCTFYC